MSILHTLLYWIGLSPTPGPRTYVIPESLQVSVNTLAQHEGRPEHELILDIVAAGLTQYSTNDKVWKQWESLTDREKEATAGVCLGRSNGQIAADMGITEAGVKFHLRNVYAKLKVKNRAGLRKKFTGWDFTGWMKIYQKFHIVK